MVGKKRAHAPDRNGACVPTRISGDAPPAPARVSIFEVTIRPGYELVTDARRPGDRIYVGMVRNTAISPKSGAGSSIGSPLARFEALLGPRGEGSAMNWRERLPERLKSYRHGQGESERSPSARA
jgi:hypothetical protein